VETVRIVEYNDGHVSARLEVARATIQTGMERQIIRRGYRPRADDDQATTLLRLFTWPDVAAATIGGEIVVGGNLIQTIHLTFEEWLTLPESLAIEWEKAVYDLNPHWLPQPQGEAPRRSGESGAMLSDSASADGSGSDRPSEIIRA
jgi:hypothetical protein